MKDCIFCKIIKGEIEKDFAYEDDYIVAFEDIRPAADTHLLFIPKKHVEDFAKLTNDKVLVSVRQACQKYIQSEKLMGRGYKIQINGGGAQIVPHLHFHLVGPIGTAAEV